MIKTTFKLKFKLEIVLK